MTDESELPAVEALARLSFAVGARMEIRSAEAGLSVQQVRLLGILRDREPTINELAAHLGVDKSSMSGAVARAERRGLVSRTTDTQDGRAVRIHLEAAGRALVDAASERFAEDACALLGVLSERQRDQWTVLTRRLIMAGANADW